MVRKQLIVQRCLNSNGHTYLSSYEMGGFHMREPYPNTQMPLSVTDEGFGSVEMAINERLMGRIGGGHSGFHIKIRKGQKSSSHDIVMK